MNAVPANSGPGRRSAVRSLLLSTILWGLAFPVMKSLALVQHNLLPHAGSWFFTALGVMCRFGIAALVLAALVWRELKTISRRELEQGALLSTFGAGGILFQMDGLFYTDASVSAFLTQGYCVFIPVWVVLVKRRWPSLKILISIALVMAGVAVLARINPSALQLARGELETLIASLLFTGQILLLENPRYGANRPGNFSTVMFLGMALLCVPLVCATAPGPAACLRAYASLPACAFLAVLIVPCTLMAYTLMNRWQKHVSATEAGLIYCVEPVFASLLSLFLPALFSAWADIAYPNEKFTLRFLLGGGMILAANLLLLSPWLEKPAEESGLG